jgi:hypothetical protein
LLARAVPPELLLDLLQGANYLDAPCVLYIFWDALFWKIEEKVLEILKKKNFEFKPKYMIRSYSSESKFSKIIREADEWEFPVPVLKSGEWRAILWEGMCKITDKSFYQEFSNFQKTSTPEAGLKWLAEKQAEGKTIWDEKKMREEIAAQKKYLFLGKDEVIRGLEGGVIKFLSSGNFLEAELAFRDKYKNEIKEFAKSDPWFK